MNTPAPLSGSRSTTGHASGLCVVAVLLVLFLLLPGRAVTQEKPVFELPLMQIGARFGTFAPGVGVIAETSFLPIPLGSTRALYTRAGIGASTTLSRADTVFHVTELLYSSLDRALTRPYTGISFLFPLSYSRQDQRVGIALISGTGFQVDLFTRGAEVLFIESGIMLSPIRGFGVINGAIGYKIALFP